VNRIELTGLKSGVPIGFMAALGAFRHTEHIGELGGVKLAWAPCGGQWCAVLHTSEAIEVETFIKLLLDRVKTLGERREFIWSEAVKSVAPDVFAKGASQAIQAASAEDHEFADWFAAFGSELALKNEKIESTPLDMTVARQLFLADAAALTTNLATPDKKAGDGLNMASFREALLGPWRYKDNQHSLGWDPSTVLMGAYTPKAPTAMNKAGVRGAVWLAMEALPFFPCVYDGGHLGTRGFVRSGRKQQFVWPIWTRPLSGDSIRTLLSHIADEGLVEEREVGRRKRLPHGDVEEWKSRGVAAVYSSEVYKPNKYLSSFQQAVLLG
jgi:hypothetical protein